jgi:hypothetical protein
MSRRGNPQVMDTDYPVDMGAVFKAIDSADVIILRSVTIPHRFLFGTRLGDVAERAAGVFSEMETLGPAEVSSALTGTGCHNVWERTR